MKRLLTILAGTTAAAGLGYAGYVGLTYVQYGRTSRQPESAAPLDEFMADYEVRERHHVRVEASAEVALAAARNVSFLDSPVVRAIFAMRALPSRLTDTPAPPLQRRPILEEVVAIGWRTLTEVPGRHVIMGAVTQPWKQNVTFRGLSPEEFVAFDEPGYAKIAWTLEAEPTGPSSCILSTETRVSTTDAASRERFRRYWSLLSPGIIIIRYEALRLARAEAERRSLA